MNLDFLIILILLIIAFLLIHFIYIYNERVKAIREKGYCVWKYNGQYYTTGCENAFQLNDNTDIYDISFCPFCGKYILWGIHEHDYNRK